MRYIIIRAEEYDDTYYNFESIFSENGCDTDAIYVPLVGQSTTFSFLKYGEPDIDIKSFDSLDSLEKELCKKYHIVKIYGFNHSGLSISTSPYGNSWDSGLIGLGLLPKAEYTEKEARDYIEKEIKFEDCLLTGDFYYVIDTEADKYERVIDSCTSRNLAEMQTMYNAKLLKLKTVTRFFDENDNEVLI